jgi:acyl-CoA thioesterase-1
MRICFFGDSFTNGTGDDSCLGWVGRVCADARQRGYDVTAYNLGIRRDTSTDILRRWENEAQARLPVGCDPHLVFAFGNNDTAPGDDGSISRLSEAETLTNAESILSQASRWAPTLLVGPVPRMDAADWDKRIIRLSGGLATLCARLEVPFLDLTALPEAFWEVWHVEASKGDGVHPNMKSYAALAANIVAWGAWRAWFKKE